MCNGIAFWRTPNRCLEALDRCMMHLVRRASHPAGVVDVSVLNFSVVDPHMIDRCSLLSVRARRMARCDGDKRKGGDNLDLDLNL